MKRAGILIGKFWAMELTINFISNPKSEFPNLKSRNLHVLQHLAIFTLNNA
jgi:hypothetical protein